MDTDSSDDMSVPTARSFANFEMFLRQHRATVNAYGLNLRASTPNNGNDLCTGTTVNTAEHQKYTPPKHHTIDAILGLKSKKEDKQHEKAGNESCGECSDCFVGKMFNFLLNRDI